MTLEYSIWSETNCNETKWFWIIDEVSDNPTQLEKTIAGGIEDTQEQALKKYAPDA